MGSIENIFQILGIEPTKEKRLIKKAYAKKVKGCHPEEEPERWKQLHDAYMEALKYAEGQARLYISAEDSPTRWYQRDEVSLMKEAKEERIVQQSVKRTDEIEQLFCEMEEQSEDKRRKLEIEYEQELTVLEKCPKRKAFQKWKDFFESPKFLFYCEENQFWKYFLDMLSKVELTGKTNKYIMEQLESLREYLSSGMKLDKVSKVRQAEKICRDKNRYFSLNGGNVKLLKSRVYIGVFIVVFGFMLTRSVREIENNRLFSVQKQVIEYLNEKYEDAAYQSGDFEVESITITSAYRYKGDFQAYRARMKEDGHKAAYIWLYKGEGMNKQAVLCFDNFQQEEIEADLQKELVKAIGAEQGMVFLSSAEPRYMQERFKEEQAVYHTRYDGDLTTFFEKEKEVRKEWIGSDKEETFNVRNNLNVNINGRCAFWFPDKEVVDIRQRLENPQSGYDENFCKAIKSIEQAYGIQVLAAALPQSYYASMVQALEKDEYSEEYKLERTGVEQVEKAPVDIPFVTVWYMAEEIDITAMMETPAYESMTSPEVMQKAKNQAGLEEVQEECEEIHTISAQKLEEGIYLMDTEEHGGFHSQRAVQHKENEISITCSDEYSSYMLILDMEKLGIEDNNYYVKSQKSGEENEAVIYEERPYTAVGEQFETVWRGEGFLFIICKPYSEYGSSTYTVVLEPKQEE